jgi:hypothetical protein
VHSFEWGCCGWALTAVVLTPRARRYIWVTCAHHGFQAGAVNLAPYNFQSFFTGANVFLWAYGGHGVSLCAARASPLPPSPPAAADTDTELPLYLHASSTLLIRMHEHACKTA